MYKINKAENRIARLESKSFAELKLRERDHLQEWLAHSPEALGEELLIIQKEFDGFDDTRERLDLLALDKEGQLVIIENKLDDTGRDVVWQALKYASYCSNLKKTQVVEIFQQYLDRYCGGDSAIALICDFLEVQDFEEVVLNSGNDQRLILVAANFRKEVTATVLWLLSHGIRTQCFRVTPFGFEDELFLDIQQIIPVPEAEEYMIGMSSKDDEEKQVQGTLKRRHKLRLEFWEKALDALRKHGVALFQNINPSKDHWLSAGSGMRACPYNMIFGKSEVRVELWIARSDTNENKYLFDELHANKEVHDEAFGSSFKWERLDDKKSSRISYAKNFDGYNKDNWPEMIEWLVDHIVRLENTFSEPLARLNRSLKAGENE